MRRPPSRSRLDRKTRGRTRPCRLRALDAFVCRCEGDVLARKDGAWASAAFVDIGFGEAPCTTVESAAEFRRLNPALRVLGVEREPSRVEAAIPFEDALTHFCEGGFDLPLPSAEPARLIRVMNVLRGYPVEDVAVVHQMLASFLLDGGLLVEGSSDTQGGVLAAHVMRRRGQALEREALLFFTDFSRGFAPILFRDWLPRDLRRKVIAGHPIHDFFGQWTAAWEAIRAESNRDPRQAFPLSVRRLARSVAGIVESDWLTERGYLLWRPPGGVPR